MERNLVSFIDNAEDRIVVEIDAEWVEDKFMQQSIGHVWIDRVHHHLGLGINWTIAKEEYTGDSYILTFERLWM